MNRGFQRRPRGNRQVETEGRSLEEAVQAAVRKLHVKREDLEYEVIEAARSGFLGLGARPARIRARLRQGGGPRQVPDGNGTGGARGGRGAGGGHRGGSRGGPRQTAEPEARRVEAPGGRREEQRDDRRDDQRDDRRDSRRDDRHEDRRGGRRPRRRRGGGRGDAQAEQSVRQDSGPRGRQRRSGGGAPRSPKPKAMDAPSEGLIIDVQDFTFELLRRMGFPGEVKVSWAEDAFEVQISAGDGDAALIGEGGETLDALQHVIAKMASRGLEHLIPVRLNIGDFRERRQEQLSNLALEYARKVRETGEEVITDPLSAAERRIIHRTLMDDPEVSTHALGNGLIKRVWIGPAGQESRAEEAERRTDTGVDRPRRSPDDETASRIVSEDAAEEDEPISMIDDWDTPAKEETQGDAPEWGRRRKPAKGRRR